MAHGSTRRRDFIALRSELLKARSLYVDPEFPPDSKSLYPTGRIPNIGSVIWKRPTDIVRNPQFTIRGAKRHDLDQGLLGDCWFVASAAVLATSHRKQFDRVVPQDQGFSDNYAGIFHFNFWWYGKWVEIVVDDYLPTDGYSLIYCHNRERKDEFWSALMEKAYAKLRGSYQALDGGKLQDALIDFTGGISEVIPISDKSNIPPNLYELLYKSHKMNSMIGGSIWRPKNAVRPEVRKENGLYMGHAYSVTGFTQLQGNRGIVKLLRLRNPWGVGEWIGPWSDRSPEMQYVTENIKKDLHIRIREEGEFWIAFEDFIENFDEIQLAHLQPDSLTQEIAADDGKQHWNVTVYHDSWIRGVTAGGCGNPPNQKLYWKNPQFFVTLKDVDSDLSDNACTLIVSLMEKERGEDTGKIAIGFTLFKLKQADRKPLDDERVSRNALKLAERSGTYQYYREMTRRFELPPGVYVVIPSTFEPHVEAEFLLRIYTEKRIDSGVLDEDAGPSTDDDPLSPIKPTEDTIADLFVKHAGRDMKMDAVELRSFLSAAFLAVSNVEVDFSLEACRSLLTMMDKNESGFLDQDETKKMWREVKTYLNVFKRFDKDNSGTVDTFELNSMFGTLGFPVSRAVLTSIVRRYGGRNNRISSEDFVIIVSKLILMYNIFIEHRSRSGGLDGVGQFTRNEFLQYTMFC